MNLKLFCVILIGILLLTLSTVNARESHTPHTSNIDYFNFLNLFFPGSPDFTYHISYRPGGAVHAWAGKQTNVTLSIEKINMTKHTEFYIKLIITRGFWEPYKTPSSESPSLLEKLKRYNMWLNNTQSLTGNLYKLSPERAYFKGNMKNLTLNLKFTIYGWGKDWGITILARPVNGSLWVPVGGIPVNVTGGAPINYVLPYLYTGGTLVLFITCAVIVKKRKFPWHPSKK